MPTVQLRFHFSVVPVSQTDLSLAEMKKKFGYN